MKKLLIVLFISCSPFLSFAQEKTMIETIKEVIKEEGIKTCYITNSVGGTLVANQEFIIRDKFLVVSKTSKKGVTKKVFYNSYRFFSFTVKEGIIYFSV